MPKKDKMPSGILTITLHRKFKRVHRLSQEARLYMYDHELLRFYNRGLREDVKVTSQLITYKSGDAVFDFGLRFEKGERFGS